MPKINRYPNTRLFLCLPCERVHVAARTLENGFDRKTIAALATMRYAKNGVPSSSPFPVVAVTMPGKPGERETEIGTVDPVTGRFAFNKPLYEKKK